MFDCLYVPILVVMGRFLPRDCLYHMYKYNIAALSKIIAVQVIVRPLKKINIYFQKLWVRITYFPLLIY